VLAWLSFSGSVRLGCIVGVHTHYSSRSRLSLSLDTFQSQLTEHATCESTRPLLGHLVYTHNDHTPFVIDFLEFVFSTVRRFAGGGLK
jgi:hypothetical protein